MSIFCGLVERTPHVDRLAVAASSSETYPILCSRYARGVALRLPSAAGKGDDVALMIDRVWAESFDARKLRRRWRLRAAQDIDRTGKLCELEFELFRSAFEQITKPAAFG